MENKKEKKVLEDYFLKEVKTSTEDLVGWRVVGTVESSGKEGSSTYKEFKTLEDGWLCEFRIKILNCGLVLVSPGGMVEENELVMEAMNAYNDVVLDPLKELQKLMEQPGPGRTATTYPAEPWWEVKPGIITYDPNSYKTWITCTDDTLLTDATSTGTWTWTNSATNAVSNLGTSTAATFSSC